MQAPPLASLYASCGVNLRKHTGRYPSWTSREPTVVDLTPAEKRLWQRAGDAALIERLQARGQFPFPSLALGGFRRTCRQTILAAPGRACLAICVPPAPHYRRLARALFDWLCAEGAPPRLIPDVEFKASLLRRRNAVILGGAHENRAAAAWADACRLDADAQLPGPRGWLIRTLHNPGNLGGNLVQICCGPPRADAALRAFRRHASKIAGGIVLPAPIWQVQRDPASFPDLRDQARVMAELNRQRPHRNRRARPPRTAFQLAARAAKDFDSGGKKPDRYNVYPLILANAAADIFSRTGERDYLDLFRAMLRALLDYFTRTPGGASIPSDIEFYAGRLIINWELLAEHLSITPEERLVYDKLLLAVMEMCAGYKAAHWPTMPGALRHNHETFGALTLFFGGRYFHEHFRWPAARAWMQIARKCFNCPQVEKYFKYKENANMYQWLAPAHKLVYDRATGRRPFADNGRMAMVARNIVITTDNFGYPSDFGDAGAPVSGGGLGADFLDAAALRGGDASLSWAADRIRRALPRPVWRDLPSTTAWLPGCRRRFPPNLPPALPQVAIMPLDEHIRRQYGPAAPSNQAYDKLAMREAWSANAQYLLMEGFSYPSGGHAHRDQNSIIRLNHLGRIWLVDNSYGKLDRKMGAGNVFRMRQTGPEDHNLVQFVLSDGKFAAYPNLCVLRCCRETDQFALAQSVLSGMAGGEWRRSILWFKGRFFLVVDTVRVGRADLAEVRCQWNMLGRLRLESEGVGVCVQDGVNFFVHYDAAPAVKLGAYCNANWRAELVPAIYPHARPPIQKMNQTYSRPAAGSLVAFANLFYAARGRRPLYALERAGDATWHVSGPGLADCPLSRSGNVRRAPGGDGWLFTAD